MATVINLFAAPGRGATTLAHAVTAELSRRFTAIMIPEEAKRLRWLGELDEAGQRYIYFTQAAMLQAVAMAPGVEFAITDAPLLARIAYTCHYQAEVAKEIEICAKVVHGQMPTLNFFIERGRIPYDPVGRFSKQEKADKIGADVRQLLEDLAIPFATLDGSKHNTSRDLIIQQAIDSAGGP